MTLLPRTLFGRNALLLLGLIAFAQLAALFVFRELVQKPRTVQLADLAADYVTGVVDGLALLPKPQRERFLQSFLQSKKVEIVPARERSPDTKRMTNPLWQQYARVVAERLQRSEQEVVYTADNQGSLWVREPIAGEDYWFIIRGLTAGTAVSGMALLIILLIFFLAVMGAFLIQRRINQPLHRLVQAASLIAQGRSPNPLPEEPPEEIATVTRAFNQMTRSLASIDQERSVMLAGVSHDLRTPLSKVRLAIEIMEEHIEPDILMNMRRSLAQIDLIIDQFMDYGRAAVGEALEWLDINEIIGECAAIRSATEPRFEMSLQPLPQLLVRRQSLIRAICNLMDNAVRYGEPAFTVSSEKREHMVRICVSDNGQGIPSNELESMKQPFKRGSAARNGSPGSGLGLAIVERIAQLHGGSLQLINQLHGGLAAIVELPASHDEQGASVS